MIFNDYVLLALGVVFAAIGGEFFVRGAVGLAHWARVSPGIIGATVAAFATSSPELTVSVTAAMTGAPQIALGSNVVNVALILGIVLLISAFRTPRNTVRRDFLVALSIPVLTGILLFDGVISRFDGVLLLGLFMVWLFGTIMEARKQRNATPKIIGEHRGWLAVVFSTVGLVLLVLAGRSIVSGATGIAVSFGIDKFIIGATIVALGTSAPELATAVIAKLRNHDEVGLGTILGSNIFNGLLIIAIASIISPISVDLHETGLVLVFGFLALVFVYPRRTGLIERRQGVLLLLLYGIYLLTIIQRHAA